MLATHKVKDNNNNIIGFILDGVFYSNYRVCANIHLISNLVNMKGTIISSKQLPIVSYDTVNKKKYNKLLEKEPFVRDIQDSLSAWKGQYKNEILQVDGAREVGKTTEVLKFAYSNYEYVIYINHMLNPILIDVESISTYCIRNNLPDFINNERSLIVIDEIQDSPMTTIGIDDAIDCDIIAISSILGCNKLSTQTRNQKIKHIKMTPLSASEARKLGIDEETYKQIGGYPAVIREHIENGYKCFNMIEAMYSSYKTEIRIRTYDKAMNLDCTVYGATNIIETIYTEIVKQHGSKDSLINSIISLLENTITKEQANDIINLMINAGQLYEYNNQLYYADCGIANYVAHITHTLDIESLKL